jgi:predicted GIY-YIG superfamily endonuclease
MSRKWSNWILLSSKSLASLDNRIPAIYRIRLVHQSNEKAVVINRFLNKDSNGIIYIGKTTNLKRRLKFFVNAYQNTYNDNHSGGNLLHYLISNKIIENFRKKYFLQFSYIHIKSKKDIDNILTKEERKKLIEYFKKFGELPVLNSETPFRKDKKSYN